jgi:hypothetical protein
MKRNYNNFKNSKNIYLPYKSSMASNCAPFKSPHSTCHYPKRHFSFFKENTADSLIRFVIDDPTRVAQLLKM